jgi:hypothetical protein
MKLYHYKRPALRVMFCDIVKIEYLSCKSVTRLSPIERRVQKGFNEWPTHCPCLSFSHYIIALCFLVPVVVEA